MFTSTRFFIASLTALASFQVSNAAPAIRKRAITPTQIAATGFDDQIRLYTTGSSATGCDGIYEISGAGRSSSATQNVYQRPGRCLGITSQYHIQGFDPEFAIAATSNGHNTPAPHSVSVFFWTRIETNSTIQTTLRRIHWTDNTGWKVDESLQYRLDNADTQILTASSFIKDGQEYWSVFYYDTQFRTVQEILWERGQWVLGAHVDAASADNVQVATWFKNGVTFKSLYVLENAVISEYFWSGGADPTINPKIREGVESFAALSITTNGEPSLRVYYQLQAQSSLPQAVTEMWEDKINGDHIVWSGDARHSLTISNTNVQKATKIVSVFQEDLTSKSGGWQTVFYLDGANEIRESHRGPDGAWASSLPLGI